MSTNNLHLGWKTLKLQLKNQHGVVNLKKLRTLERDYIRLAQVRNNITFLRHCCTHGVIPKGLHIKAPVKSNQIIKVIEKTSLNIVKIMRNQNYCEKYHIEDRIRRREHEILGLLPEHKLRILNLMDSSYKYKFEKTKTTQMKKLDNLIKSKLSNLISNNQKTHSTTFIKNISSTTLTKIEENVLSLGMNFSVPKKSLFNNNVDTVLAIENRLWRDDSLSEAKMNNVRKQVADVLDTPLGIKMKNNSTIKLSKRYNK